MFRLFVRSWRKIVPNMIHMGISENSIGLDGEIHRSNSIAGNKSTILDNGAQKRIDLTYMKAHENSSIWEFRIEMDTDSEEACNIGYPTYPIEKE